MQINRLFEIVYILLGKKITTAKELAERFEVSVRTIYRDIDTLSSAGIPIYASQGKGGGISLLDDYVLNKSVLSEIEQDEILFALQSLTITQNPETDRVLSKLSSLFNKSKTNWIEVDRSPWGSDKNKTCEFTILKNAILNHQIIEFNYFNASGEKSHRKVEPVKLLFKVHAWYLQGFCLSKNEYRTFKISRMSDVQITQEIFADRLLEELPEDQKEQRTQKWIDVQLQISPHGAYRVFDEFNEKEITKNQDGSFTIVTALPESKWLFNYILSFGADVEVLAPQNIREMIQNKLDEVIWKYKNKK
ncbi:MAG: YafY family transcriptional regulator [Clostridium sp.]|jgi:predicted DNA-binding transcriptional regulator YafY|uniref:helix-turn-helix transcriptional regulator n=1 Tax=Clostridium sp. TaxID=1506 RepID=UPI0025C5BF79|nr:YafY family protein [Clostridium sp.]MCH3965440.1 YafY family transcriptional regulator [Clostridium sp.]MCI1717279.1 YafY family transcriptional regulator [Clostridium sp.]MCI1801619.1 YafY family transcriptional regulator [Clostridium sp.]MCI1815465.1 YafY family transcriptional regulator [Clostridium sp.]MCI1872368.1 YafY family transcriptional regulator [Clostridium sp.]